MRIAQLRRGSSSTTAIDEARAVVRAGAPRAAEEIAQPTCACGGGCPRCATEAAVAPSVPVDAPNTAHEMEADRVADAVAAGTSGARVASAPAASDGEAMRAPSDVEGVVRRPGEPLAPTVRRMMAERIGRDFRQVRVHTDARAAESARAVGAVAYTVGEHVVFAAGQYAPHTRSGRRLLAHELAHVAQQADGGGRRVQRMSIGAGTPPTWQGLTVTAIPNDELARVREAIALIRKVVDDPRGYDDCHAYFTRRCPNGTAASLPDAFRQAVLWRLHEGGDVLARGDAPGRDIAYSADGYSQGAEKLAGTLVHEMMHNCGISGESDHHLAEVALLYCIGAGRNLLGFRFGSTLGAVPAPVAAISYRRFLASWAEGRLRLGAGFDVNVLGSALQGSALERNAPTELGGGMIGLHGRSNLLWGGERFGGLTANVEGGLGAARFTLRPATPTESRTEIGAGAILQIGAGAEFYIPVGADAVPVSLDVAYRMVQPLNGEAERIHSIVAGISFPL